MPVTETIAERLLAAVKTAVDGITTGAGYRQTLSAYRPSPGGNAAFVEANGRVVVYAESDLPDPDYDLSGNVNRRGRRLRVSLVAWIIPAASDATPVDTLLTRAAGDLQKKLMADPQWSSLAIESFWGDTEFLDYDEGRTGLTQSLEIVYRTPEGNPDAVA